MIAARFRLCNLGYSAVSDWALAGCILTYKMTIRFALWLLH